MLSELEEKSEYEKILDEYNNNYGINIGINQKNNQVLNEKIDFNLKNTFRMK